MHKNYKMLLKCDLAYSRVPNKQGGRLEIRNMHWLEIFIDINIEISEVDHYTWILTSRNSHKVENLISRGGGGPNKSREVGKIFDKKGRPLLWTWESSNYLSLDFILCVSLQYWPEKLFVKFHRDVFFIWELLPKNTFNSVKKLPNWFTLII